MGGFNTGSQSGAGVGVGMNMSIGESGATSEAVFEPTAQRLNRLLIAQLEGMFAGTMDPLGPKPVAPPKGAPKADVAAYKADLKAWEKAWEKDSKERGKFTSSLEQRGGLTPFMRDMSALTTPGADELGYLTRIRGLAEGPRVGAEEQVGMDALRAAMDPTASVDAAKRTLSDIVTPSLVNTMTAQGMGRSGAVGEALTKEGTALTLPIFEAVRSAQLGGGAKLLDYGQQVESRQAGRLLSALEAARIPRDAAMQEKFRPAQLLSSLMGRLPAGVGVGSNSSSFSNQIATGLNLSSQQSSGKQFGVNVGGK
jgi:hypothetical protein